MLPVLASLRRPVRLRLEPVWTLSEVSCAVAPLKPVAELSCPGTPSVCFPDEAAPAASALRLDSDWTAEFSGDALEVWA